MGKKTQYTGNTEYDDDWSEDDDADIDQFDDPQETVPVRTSASSKLDMRRRIEQMAEERLLRSQIDYDL